MDADALEALRLLGVDARVAAHLAAVMDLAVLTLPGGEEITWSMEHICVTTTAAGGVRLRFCTTGLLTIDAILPETVCMELTGAPLSRLSDHPMLPGARIMVDVRASASQSFTRFRLEGAPRTSARRRAATAEAAV